MSRRTIRLSPWRGVSQGVNVTVCYSRVGSKSWQRRRPSRPERSAGERRAVAAVGTIPQRMYYGDNIKIECPTGSGNSMNLFEIAREIAHQLTRIFLRDQ